jgi:hypothetical protein
MKIRRHHAFSAVAHDASYAASGHRILPSSQRLLRPGSRQLDARQPRQGTNSLQVCLLFGTAYSKAASIGTAVTRYRKAGIWRVDRAVFNECDFVPWDVTYQPLESDSGTSEVNVPPTGTVDVLPLV